MDTPYFSATVHNAGKAKMKVDKEDSDFSLIERSIALGLVSLQNWKAC